MKEEERQKRLATIQEKVEEVKRLREMQKELNRLKSSPDVKRYLELESELEDEEILTKKEISKKVMEKYLGYNVCCHDIFYYCGGYSVEPDFGPESRNRYYREADPNKIQIYIYRCLDCFYEIEVSKKDNEKFLKEHTVIKTKSSFDECRKIYCELLCTNRCDNAIQKLLKKN